MAGKSGRTISTVPEKKLMKSLVSWEGILFVLFIGINIFCKCISPVYNFTNVLREMPKYLTEIFLLFPMAYILLKSASISSSVDGPKWSASLFAPGPGVG